MNQRLFGVVKKTVAVEYGIPPRRRLVTSVIIVGLKGMICSRPLIQT